MACDPKITENLALKAIPFNSSHAAALRISDDNFNALQEYMNNLLCRIIELEGAQTTTGDPTTTLILNTVAENMIFSTEIQPTQTDGTTVVINDLSVTRNGLQWSIQHPNNHKTVLHGLRIKSTGEYAQGYNSIVNPTTNQITITFTAIPDEDLEFIMIGYL